MNQLKERIILAHRGGDVFCLMEQGSPVQWDAQLVTLRMQSGMWKLPPSLSPFVSVCDDANFRMSLSSDIPLEMFSQNGSWLCLHEIGNFKSIYITNDARVLSVERINWVPSIRTNKINFWVGVVAVIICTKLVHPQVEFLSSLYALTIFNNEIV